MSVRVNSQHRLAGKTVNLDNGRGDPARGLVVRAAQFEVEATFAELAEAGDISGKVWDDSPANWAVLHYQNRALLTGLPRDENVVYGKIEGLGHIVHESELPNA